MYVIRTLFFVYLSLFLDRFPLDPRCLLANELSQHIYKTYVSDILGLVGGTKLSKLKKTKYNYKL